MIDRVLKTLQQAGASQFVTTHLNLLELLFDSTLYCAALVDRNLRFAHVNGAFARAARREYSAIAGAECFEILHHSLQPHFSEALDKRRPVSTQAAPFRQAEAPQSAESAWECTLLPVLDRADNVVLLILALNDTRIQISQFEQLRVARDQVLLLLRRLPELLEHESMSLPLHDEFRRSLTAIKLAIEAEMLGHRAPMEEENEGALHDLLTVREYQVLLMAIAGRTSNDIGKALYISPRTVEKHRANIYRKLEIGSQTELVLYAVQHGLLPED